MEDTKPIVEEEGQAEAFTYRVYKRRWAMVVTVLLLSISNSGVRIHTHTHTHTHTYTHCS